MWCGIQPSYCEVQLYPRYKPGSRSCPERPKGWDTETSPTKKRAKQLLPSSIAHLEFENDKRIVYRRLTLETQLGSVQRLLMHLKGGTVLPRAVTSKKEGRFAAALFIPFLLPLPLLNQAALAALFLSAQRFFIISEMRLFAAALKRRRPRLPLPTAVRPRRPLMEPRRADIACSRRSLSDSNSEMICCVSI